MAECQQGDTLLLTRVFLIPVELRGIYDAQQMACGNNDFQCVFDRIDVRSFVNCSITVKPEETLEESLLVGKIALTIRSLQPRRLHFLEKLAGQP